MRTRPKLAKKTQDPAKIVRPQGAQGIRPNLSKRSLFPKDAVQLLNRYYYEENLTKPSQIEQQQICDEINGLAMDPPFAIARGQVYNWFSNKRKNRNLMDK